MAYAATTPSRLGRKNADASEGANDLFLKVFSGEVITVFDNVNVMLGTTQVRSISSGKSAQFPATGVANATYHTPGQDILTEDGASPTYLSQIKHNEIIITINDLLVSSVFIDSLDEAKNHYDIRGEYSKQMAVALSTTADKNLIQLGITGARAGTDRFGDDSASSLYRGLQIDIGADDVASVTGAEMIANLFTAAEHMDARNVPSEDRYCVVAPSTYYTLIASGDGATGGLVINRDYGNEGNGSIAGGTIYSVAGFKILKSNNLPTDDVTAAAGDLSSIPASANYDSDGARPVALAYHKSGLGTVKLKDLKVESEYLISRQGNLVVASYAMGHDILRNECLVELCT